MTTTRPATSNARPGVVIAVLLIVLAIEIAFYPEIATALNHILGDGAAPGSSMGYFRSYYAAPILGAFGVFSALLIWAAGRRSHRPFRVVLAAIGLADVVILAATSLWYFRSIAAAAGARTP